MYPKQKVPLAHSRSACVCSKPPSYVLYKGTYVLYNGTYGTSDQGQMLDM
jgi:hypothetical protein